MAVHAIHRPHLPHAVLVTALGLLLAIVLVLALAAGIDDRGSTGGSAVLPHAAAAAQQAPTGAARGPNPFMVNPLKRAFTAPVRLPWESRPAV